MVLRTLLHLTALRHLALLHLIRVPSTSTAPWQDETIATLRKELARAHASNNATISHQRAELTNLRRVNESLVSTAATTAATTAAHSAAATAASCKPSPEHVSRVKTLEKEGAAERQRANNALAENQRLHVQIDRLGRLEESLRYTTASAKYYNHNQHKHNQHHTLSSPLLTRSRNELAQEQIAHNATANNYQGMRRDVEKAEDTTRAMNDRIMQLEVKVRAASCKFIPVATVACRLVLHGLN
jgi:hypothetical protein